MELIDPHSYAGNVKVSGISSGNTSSAPNSPELPKRIVQEGEQQPDLFVNQQERDKLENSANAMFDALNTGLAMKFHERSGRWYATIENKLTKEVIKEIPPKYLLDLQAKLKEMVGIFLDKKI